jgi:hypothetical protein
LLMEIPERAAMSWRSVLDSSDMRIAVWTIFATSLTSLLGSVSRGVIRSQLAAGFGT